MQDRYVGDVGDFAKYALLRRLIGRPGERQTRLGLVWCLFPNEAHNNDGRHVAYLGKAEFQGMDDALLDALHKIVKSGHRCIAAVNDSGLFPEGTTFCNAATAPRVGLRPLRSDLLRHRAAWLTLCLRSTEKCDLVFFDPDNGVEAASVPKHHPNAGKYIYWDELVQFWYRRQALLVYHHLNRTKPAAHQVRELKDRFQAELDGASVLPLVFRRGSCRVFWLVYRSSPIGAKLERRSLDFLASGWSRHFRSADWLDEEVVTDWAV